MRCVRWLTLALLVAVPNVPAADQLFDLQPVVPGVWAAIARPQYKINCNAAIVELDDGLLVVDTHSKPSAARALIEQIKTVSPKPVKFVVNTHFHWDHYQGNAAYPSAWPAGIEIISSEATRESIEHRGIPRLKNQLVEVPKEIEKLKSDLDKSSGPEQRAEIGNNLRQAEAYLAELKSMQVVLPSLTFDRSLIIHRPSRTVHILWLGKAHTDGDIWILLPKEKVLASGDALHTFTPYMADGYPYDWIRTLEAAEVLDFEHVIPGHGPVLHDKKQFQAWKEYFRNLMAETASAYASGATMAETVQRISPGLLAKHQGAMPATFPTDIIPNIQKAYRVVSGATE
jgi:glyoxylase-like metal-dependent hydrolase (beta-lactamase superfamily II)